MIGFAMYNDKRNHEYVVQLQDHGCYVGEISIFWDYAKEFVNGLQISGAYCEAIKELVEFAEEMIGNELPETEQEQ